MKRLIFGLLVFCVTSLLGSSLSGQPQSGQQPARQKNYYSCVHGYSGCDPSQLTDAERIEVQRAAHLRNYNNCLHGHSGCDSSQLTASEKESVAKGEPDNASATPTPAQKTTPHFYTNRDGQRVQSPTHSESVPPGASARCRDGTYSFSQHRRGTCSHHGGVARWL